MELNLSRSIAPLSIDIEAIGTFIASLQKADGEIPWSQGGKTDPWDHVESAMGLSMSGYLEEAERAYDWMAKTQLADGSWWASTRNGLVEDTTKDANFSSYIAVGIFHHYLMTRDVAFLRRMWPTLKAAMDYALALQAPTGEIYWARDVNGVIDPMALLTGSSSVFMSLKCAMVIAASLEKRKPTWEKALEKLGHAIRFRPNRFNMIKSRFSMDWYYPVLCGALNGDDARRRIDKYWDKFVVPDWGVRCVSDRPWTTMAETAELVLTLAAIGEQERAKAVFSWLLDKKYEDGSYWMGVTFPDGVIWPEEKTSWTAAAILLAYDALHHLTPAALLFSHKFWDAIASRPAHRPRQHSARHRKAEPLGDTGTPLPPP